MKTHEPVSRLLTASAATILAALAVFAFPSDAAAQSQATTGVIRGVVSDSAGGAVPGVTITVRNLGTNFQRTVQTNEAGAFAATLLPLGTYDLAARRIGYRPESRQGLLVRVGATVDLSLVLARQATELSQVTVTAQQPVIDVSRVEAATQLSDEVVSGLPNNGRNYLNLTLLTPNVALASGPDGDELSIAGQRGIHNNVSVDGADFNNPFFGEQRGGQRPAFTFNLDAVQEMVVIANGANAEFGRSGGGFVNVITKSGTNTLHGSAHYYGKPGAFASDARHAGITNAPDFTQQQFGFTLGGPIVRDRFFYFVAYDQQVYEETKQKTRPQSASFTQLQNFLNAAFGGVLRNDFGPITRTNDANALMVKVDWRVNARSNASLKYNYTNSRQENGTFDVDTWGRSANALEKDYSHALNGSLLSQLSSSLSNEFRFQLAREDRPRPYNGPLNPATGRPFPDVAIAGEGEESFRFGLPFFIPVKAYDTRIQVLDNVSFVRGDHLFKIGAEWNRTEANQTFIGFANGRYFFSSVQGFINFVEQGPTYTDAGGPVLLYLQQMGVGGRTVEQAGTQSIPQHEVDAFIQDSWKVAPTLTVNYGLRWGAQIQPDPITPPGEVFFAPFIGKTVTNATGTYTFPSDGKIPSDWKMFQPRFGFAWDAMGDGSTVLRGSTGVYYARIPGLNLASTRSTNGSIGQTYAAGSFFGTLPAFGQLVAPLAGVPDHPGVFVFDKEFRNPRTWSSTLGFERALFPSAFTGLVGEMHATYARTDFLTRFVDRNDAVFGSPWSTGISGTNGVSTLTVVESSAKSRYTGLTLVLKRIAEDRPVQFQANYTLSYDKADDDNERDPFSFRYVRPDRLDREYNWSDRDQRHRFNGWMLLELPWQFYMNNRVSIYSAQPRSEGCSASNQPTGRPPTFLEPRLCPNGTIIKRNTIRRDNSFASWDVRLSKAFPVRGSGQIEGIFEVFNVLNRDNFRDPSAVPSLFNFDGTLRSGLGDPRQVQAGVRYVF